MGRKYRKPKSPGEVFISIIILLMIFGGTLTLILPLAIVGLLSYAGYRFINYQLSLNQGKTAKRLQDLKDKIGQADRNLKKLDKYWENKAYEDYQTLSHQLLPQLSSIQTEATNLKAKMGDQVYGRINTKVTQVTKTISTNLTELKELLAVSEEERQIQQLAPELLELYRRIKTDDQHIQEKIPLASNPAELAALHEGNMKRFETILQGYLNIKQSPKDYYNAQERLDLALKAMEQFDKDLDELLRQLNEDDMHDFEVNLRLMTKD